LKKFGKLGINIYQWREDGKLIEEHLRKMAKIIKPDYKHHDCYDDYEIDDNTFIIYYEEPSRCSCCGGEDYYSIKIHFDDIGLDSKELREKYEKIHLEQKEEQRRQKIEEMKLEKEERKLQKIAQEEEEEEEEEEEKELYKELKKKYEK